MRVYSPNGGTSAAKVVVYLAITVKYLRGQCAASWLDWREPLASPVNLVSPTFVFSSPLLSTSPRFVRTSHFPLMCSERGFEKSFIYTRTFFRGTWTVFNCDAASMNENFESVNGWNVYLSARVVSLKFLSISLLMHCRNDALSMLRSIKYERIVGIIYPSIMIYRIKLDL